MFCRWEKGSIGYKKGYGVLGTSTSTIPQVNSIILPMCTGWSLGFYRETTLTRKHTLKNFYCVVDVILVLVHSL